MPFIATHTHVNNLASGAEENVGDGQSDCDSPAGVSVNWQDCDKTLDLSGVNLRGARLSGVTCDAGTVWTDGKPVPNPPSCPSS